MLGTCFFFTRCSSCMVKISLQVFWRKGLTCFVDMRSLQSWWTFICEALHKVDSADCQPRRGPAKQRSTNSSQGAARLQIGAGEITLSGRRDGSLHGCVGVWVGGLNTCQQRTFGIEIVHYNIMQFNTCIAGLKADHSGLHPLDISLSTTVHLMRWHHG
jgi:hypothetical protein